ncbi:MAG: glycosyltransferase family 39 protein, partial [Armatimonadota bacterium]|nr:glycosyltransferase family 39 protein [Armatimonadota bacterium]
MIPIIPATRAAPALWLKSQVSALAGVLLLALVLRLYALEAKSLSFDELYSFFVARHTLSGITRLIGQHDTHPPLYYATLRLWMAAVGSSEVALRLLSILGGLTTVFLTYLVAARLASPAVGLIAALIV